MFICLGPQEAVHNRSDCKLLTDSQLNTTSYLINPSEGLKADRKPHDLILSEGNTGGREDQGEG